MVVCYVYFILIPLLWINVWSTDVTVTAETLRKEIEGARAEDVPRIFLSLKKTDFDDLPSEEQLEGCADERQTLINLPDRNPTMEYETIISPLSEIELTKGAEETDPVIISIKAKCGPNQEIKFSLKTSDANNLWEGLKNKAKRIDFKPTGYEIKITDLVDPITKFPRPSLLIEKETSTGTWAVTLVYPCYAFGETMDETQPTVCVRTHQLVPGLGLL